MGQQVRSDGPARHLDRAGRLAGQEVQLRLPRIVGQDEDQRRADLLRPHSADQPQDRFWRQGRRRRWRQEEGLPPLLRERERPCPLLLATIFVIAPPLNVDRMQALLPTSPAIATAIGCDDDYIPYHPPPRGLFHPSPPLHISC